ncbi:MAG: hypothetical protein CO189_08140 [candidate division Zixibacteria bacterium CG_4_9_14_3_um_filter_46_8]|nr:MAG: hypothetical protein CO189_08140 [candidate division Zixibacteria bacterium CG_4_9_14_3_um_filter_46_8]
MDHQESKSSLMIRITLIAISLFILLNGSNCISWNVRTVLESRYSRDGQLKRNGLITLKQFDVDSLENRLPMAIDSSEAKAFLNQHYVAPPDTKFQYSRQDSDSSFSAAWSLDINTPPTHFSDYHKLTDDSAAFSGNRIKVIQNKKFFRTDFEYQEIFFDAIPITDTIIAHLPKILPYAENTFFQNLKLFASSTAARDALKNSKDPISDELTRFWNQYIKPYLYDPANWKGEDSFGDSLLNKTVLSILSTLRTHPGGEGFTIENVDKAIEAANDEIALQFDQRGYDITGAYNIGGNNQYNFTLKLYLPGRIEATNADSVASDHLEWDFSNYEFRGNQLLLYARTSEYHWFSLVITLLAAVAIMILIALLAKKLAQPKRS